MLRNKSLLAFSITLIAILLLSLVGCITINQAGQQPDNEESGAVTEQESNQANQPIQSTQPTQSNQPNQPPSQPPPTQTTIANWTGTWQCGQIKMYLSQTGSQVTGWYEYQNGRIEGFATGTTLVGTWSETSNSGDIQLTISADGTSLTGYYRFGSSGDWDGSWSCTRTSTAQPPSPPPAQVTVANWTGTWQCGQTKMYLSQTGNQVTGWYDSLNGKIEGFATGTTLVGTWSDSSNSGDVQFTMSADGTSSTGDYRFGSSGDWDAHWSCTRISTAQPPSPPPAQAAAINWTGTWDCGNWGKMYLIQTGSQVTGTYEYQNGKIEGFATGTTLVGTWSESPTYSPPDKAGDTQFTLSADGNSFTGYWRYGSSGNWTGTWNGTRMQ